MLLSINTTTLLHITNITRLLPSEITGQTLKVVQQPILTPAALSAAMIPIHKQNNSCINISLHGNQTHLEVLFQ